MAHYALRGPSQFDAWDQSTAYMHRLKWILLLSSPSELVENASKEYNYYLNLDTVSENIKKQEEPPEDNQDALSTRTFESHGIMESPKKGFEPKRTLIQTKLSFPLISLEEKKALDTKRYYKQREENQMFLEKQNLLKQKKIEDERTYNRERKREWRKQRKEAQQTSEIVKPHSSSTVNTCTTLDLKTRQSLLALTHPYSVINTKAKKQDALGTSKGMEPYVATHVMNWTHPLVWSTIQKAAEKVGYPWSPSLIVRECQHSNPELFATLRPQRISQWQDHKFPGELKWTESHMRAIAAGCHPNAGERKKGVFANHPEVSKAITTRLTNLRANGTPLNMATIRGFMFGVIKHQVPEVLNTPTNTGRTFRCSNRFIRRFLHNELNMSIRKATRASQKHPPNVNDVLYEALLRIACVVRDKGIPACCIVNADQTQVEYSPGSQTTWNKKGERQVHVLGMEDKRAFTLLVAAAASGKVLPPQAIYTGMSARSLPSPESPEYPTIMGLQFLLEFSETDSYWSTFETMVSWVSRDLAPFLRSKIAENHLPNTQRCILLIDCWSVHKSAKFWGWMASNYPWIVLLYIPGGCTGLFQPCDVGLQQILKKAIQDAAHNDIVQETIQALESGAAPAAIVNDRTIGTLRNRSVNWILQGYRAINSPKVVEKVQC